MVLLVIVTLLASIMTSGFASGIEAYPKDGFRLVAQDSDSTGIAINTEFLLETETDYSLEEIRNAFSIDGEPAPNIDELDTNFYSIKLARPLMENSLYTFRINMDKETTWVFQTQSSFKILGSLPGEKSTNVPINSGIEINFSHDNFSDIQSHFEITPAVKGRFEVHKKTAVFVPDLLEYETVYTVRIKKGVQIQGTSRTINEDYIFTFETANKPNPSSTPSPDEIITSISVGRYLYDFASDEKPEVLLNYSIYNNSGNTFTPPVINAKIDIYAYNNFEAFFKAIEEKNSTPYWARSYSKHFTSVENLQKVLDFEQVINEDNNKRYGYTYLKVPQTLPEGYYVLDGNWKDVRFQTLIQVTNTGVYISESNTKTLVWLNDLSTQSPIEGASISFEGFDEVYSSGDDGVAYFDSLSVPVNNNTKNTYYYNFYSYNRYNRYMIVNTKEGKSSVLDCSSYSYFNENKYWSYFYTDRGMYKSDDTISFWGYIKNRYENEQIDNLTLEINQNYYYSNSTPIIKQNIAVNNSFYEGSIKLPDLPKGSYYITLKKGDTILINQYIKVENYTKPSYKLEITKDKNAIFVDEEANFNIKAAFFEGTGVSNVNITYDVNSYELGGNIPGITEKADLKGNISLKYSPTAYSDVQGIHNASIYARATLPESGQIDASDYLRVFVNDIHIQSDAKIKNGIATVSAKVNKIVLDRINNGTAKNSYDYLGDPVASQKIQGTIYKNWWVRTEVGTYYDYINKTSYKRYSHDLKTERVNTFSMVTSSDGTASYNFDAPEINDGYYTIGIQSTDGNGRNISHKLYCGRVYDYSSYNNPTYTLEGNKDSYKLGEDVDVTFKYGGEPLPEGKYIYYKAQNGNYEYNVGTSSSYSFDFSEKDIPNTTVYGVYFNGKTYVSNSYIATFDIQEKNLTIEAKTDKDFYKPGDTVTINLDVKDLNGNPVKSTINLSVVDEAFFYLLDQNVDLLSSLYVHVNSGVYYEGKSHLLSLGQDYYDRLPVYAEANTGGGGAKSSSEPNVREDFKDTAQFVTVQTDDTGRGQTTFKLPDNITSWRVTLSAISDDLHAGSDKVSMIVTLPFFINYSFNTTYLEGDKPVLGVNAYGNGLDENNDITFEVTGSDASSPKLTVKGKAFERINIPLWALNEGKQDITIKAYSDNGYSDAVKHSFNVVKSYYQIEKALFYDIAPNMTIEGGKSGFTNIAFQDKSTGMYLSDLFNLRYTYGERIDQIISGYTASQLIAKYFKDINTGGELQKPSLTEYQKSDGGLSLLPYSESDIVLTAKLTTFAKSMVNTKLLKDYYYNILEGKSTSDKAKAIYGLSVLKEPILLELEKIAQIDNLSVEDLVYIALTYCELGDISTAAQIYKNKIYSYVEKFDPYYRVKVEGDQDNILEVTSLCAYLTAKLQTPESQGLYAYCQKNYTRDILIATERLMFISTALEKQEPSEGKITYSLAGESNTITVANGSTHHLKLLPFQLADFKVTGVEGTVSAVSIFKEDILEVNKLDEDISVRRTYLFTNDIPLSSNTLKQGDVIKVRLEWDIKDEAFDGTYLLTDYLPSGLKPYNSYWNTEGQKISFYVSSHSYWRDYIDYYARVISPGTYTAQGPVIQGLNSRDNINTGKTEIVTIEATEPILTPIEELPTPTPTPIEDILYGDVDGNDMVNSIDFALIRMYLLGLKRQLPMSDKYADLNGDGNVNALDLALMRQYLLGYIKKFPVENKK